MLPHKSEPESLMGSHCCIKEVHKRRHFGLRDVVSDPGGQKLGSSVRDPVTSFQGGPVPGPAPPHDRSREVAEWPGKTNAERWEERDFRNETSREKANLEGLLRGALGLLFQLFLAQAAAAEPAHLPQGPRSRLWVQGQSRGRGAGVGTPKLARVQLRRRERPRGESAATQRPPTPARGQIRNQHIFTAVGEIAEINESHPHITSPKGLALMLIRTFPDGKKILCWTH